MDLSLGCESLLFLGWGRGRERTPLKGPQSTHPLPHSLVEKRALRCHYAVSGSWDLSHGPMPLPHGLCGVFLEAMSGCGVVRERTVSLLGQEPTKAFLKTLVQIKVLESQNETERLGRGAGQGGSRGGGDIQGP